MTNKEIFVAGWNSAFRYCNPDVGFNLKGSSNPESAYYVWLGQQVESESSSVIVANFHHANDIRVLEMEGNYIIQIYTGEWESLGANFQQKAVQQTINAIEMLFKRRLYGNSRFGPAR